MGFSGWDRVAIETSDGVKTAVAPVIISASRANGSKPSNNSPKKSGKSE